ncbi:co-chaperone GroES [Patescibacteria group bacterium]|nr:co-chaperone GroES [Patescibacteria group bacterium]
MKLKPLADNIVVKGISNEEVTKSGIIIPDTVDKEKPEQGEVVAIGPGKMLDNGQRSPMEVKVGDRILFKKYGPDDFKLDGEEVLVLKQEDVIAIIENSKEQAEQISEANKIQENRQSYGHNANK